MMTILRLLMLVLLLCTCACVVHGRSALRHGGDPVTKKEPYGYTIRLEPSHPPDPSPWYKPGEGHVIYRGEFIGCDEDRVYILLHDARPDAPMAFKWDALMSGSIEIPTIAPLVFALWTVGGSLSAISHGWFMIGTMPAWGAVGFSVSFASIPVYMRAGMKDTCRKLGLYSRFPQGIPAAVREQFKEAEAPEEEAEEETERAGAARAWITMPWGGFGIFGSLVLGDVRESTFKTAPGADAIHVHQTGVTTGGVGLFGEYMVRPYFAAGAETSVDFPRIQQGSDPGEDNLCIMCDQNVIMRFLFRGKFPIRAAGGLFLGPLILAGYSFYFSGVFNHGMSFGTGVNVQVHTRTVTPLFEARYMLHLGWYDADIAQYGVYGHDVEHEIILYHAAVLVLGLRVP